MERSKAIDILRALAVLLVLGRHMPDCSPTVNSFIRGVMSVWHEGGWMGVNLFFVLSGFLVSGLLFREHEKYGRISVGRFFVRRGLKIYPSFWLLMAAVVVAAHFQVDWRRVLAELLFVQNYFHGMWGHTWSLAVEEHFYLLLALLLWMLSRRGKSLDVFKSIPAIFLFLAVVCLGLRLWESQYPFDYLTHIDPTHLRMDSLFAGVFLSYLYHRYPAKFQSVTRPWRWALIVLGLLLLSPGFILHQETSVFITTFGLTLFYLGSACLLAGFLALKLPSWRVIAVTGYVGAHSYSIYIWHQWVEMSLNRRVFQAGHWYAGAVLFLAVSILFGIFMSLIVEFPVLKFRDRWFPPRSPALKKIKAAKPPPETSLLQPFRHFYRRVRN